MVDLCSAVFTLAPDLSSTGYKSMFKSSDFLKLKALVHEADRRISCSTSQRFLVIIQMLSEPLASCKVES